MIRFIGILLEVIFVTADVPVDVGSAVDAAIVLLIEVNLLVVITSVLELESLLVVAEITFNNLCLRKTGGFGQ